MSVTSESQDYTSEERRRASFIRWPDTAPVDASVLSKAGFIYLGINLLVQCFSCKVRIDDWHMGDDAFNKHRQYSSNCPFLVTFCSLPNHNRDEDDDIQCDGIDISRPSNMLASAASVKSPDSSDSVASCTSSSTRRNTEKTWTSFESLRFESERLKTFAMWSVHYINPRDLAKDGFFYLREEDKVQCVFCQGIVGEWEENDIPHEEHMRHFPKCGFILNLHVGNVPIDNDSSSAGHSKRPGRDVCGRERSTNDYWRNSVPERTPAPSSMQYQTTQFEELGITRHMGPRYKDYATEESRKKTFDNWPPALVQKPDSLAEAGFYYCSISDHVRCFHCGGGLRNWEPLDKPWIEHARWFPQCAFIRLVKGEEFVNDVRAQHPTYSSQSSSSSDGTPPSTPEVEPKAYPSYSVREVSDAEVQALMEVEPAKTVLGLGVDRGAVRVAILNKMRETGVPYTTPEMLIEAAFSTEETIQEEREISEIAENSSSPFTGIEERNLSELRSYMNINETQSPSHEVANSLDHMQIQSEIPVSVKETDKIEAMETNIEDNDKDTMEGVKEQEGGTLEEENRKLKEALKEQKLCKICLDKEVGVVFLPCGHLLSCVQCAPALKDCPMCRKEIRASVRTYMS